MATTTSKNAAAAPEYINRPTVDNAPYAEYGRELVNSALYGALLSGGGAALYQLISGARQSDPKTLLHNPIPYLNLQMATQQKQKKKTQNHKPRKELELKTAAADGFLQQAFTGLGKSIPPQFLFNVSLPGGTSNAESPTIAHRGWRTAANYLAAVGGGYGGLALVKAITDQKKKEDLADEVETARQDYFNALTGKSAAVLDAAYEKHAQAETAQPVGESWLARAWNSLPNMRDVSVHTSNLSERGAEALWSTALLTALGSGAIGAKYMYDHTKARTAAENLRKARDSRARLRGLQQTPYVDPGELAAIAGR